MGMLGFVALASVAHGQTRGGFDGSGHLLMHGTPRFVLGVYDSGGAYSSDSAFWEDAIFSPAGPRGLQDFPLNVYLNYWLGGMPIGQTNALLDVLHGHGMMYLQTGNCFADGSWTRYGTAGFSIASQSYVQQFAQHPAALGYYIMDECDDTLIPETQQHYQQLKSWDPQGVALATALAAAYRDPSLWVNATDVLALDPYPLYGTEPTQGYPHFTVADFTAKLRAAGRADRPVWTVLQFFKFTSDSRMLTAGELRSHAVMAIVEGAQGLFWWDIGVNGLRQLAAAAVSTSMSDLKTLTTELAGLEPALLAPPADSALVGNTTRFSDPVAGRIAQLQHNIAVEILYSRVQADQAEIAALQAGDTSKSPLLAGAANVRTRTKIVNGVGYVFAYNYTNLQQPVTFTWQSSVTSVRESKSGAAYGVNGASWSDTFGPYESRIYIVTGAGSSRIVGDFNGDGKADLLWRDTAGNVTMWLMNGPSVTTSLGLGAVSTAWSIVGVGDFDGDGKADVLWRDASGNVAMWLMNGSAVVGNRFLGNVSTDWTVQTVADFDGDGRADILWRNTTSGVVSLWLMNGAAVGLGVVSTAWSIAGVGDFNGDGKADLVWRDTSGNLVMWLMNGGTVSGTSSLGNVPLAWTIVGVGDFDGDGKGDLLWRDATGNVAMWLMNGGAIASNAFLGSVPTTWRIDRVRDFNGDGKADILWRHSSGALSQWLMNGTSVMGTGALGTVATEWATQ
jgi:hypothetical protein